ncbi:hypothetical protein J2P12_01015 [Candidatus Bathyarchaeota archaeon]|nr:hypothetical protein [Candidatus Bathyarchaeota archaeon]
MPRTWTPEQRKELAERQKQRWAEKKSKPPAAAQELEQQLNPIANDVLPEKKQRLKPASPPPPPQPTALFSTATIISQLESIPLQSVSYADCGLLLNALSACSTKVALARRQKQEQLEAGTHRAPCKTCGRMIDISKSGGFQILTDYDDHRMMVNVYYCSQNCLLAKNMPSHARQTPKEKRANQA